MNKKLFLLPTIIVIMDQITKILIRLNFTRSESIDIFGSIMRFTYTENPGAAFGIRLNHPIMNRILLSSISFIAVFFIIYLIKNAESKIQLISFHLILAGAFGNLIDRSIRGSVTDFIDCDFPDIIAQFWSSSRWPIFNIADSVIVIAFVLLVYEIIFRNKINTEEK